MHDRQDDSNVDDLFDKVKSFLHNKLLYWIEACSWLDAFAGVVKSLNTARRCFAVRQYTYHLVPACGLPIFLAL